MKFKRESQYGLTGLAILAQQPSGTVMALEEIAAAQQLPRVFLAKIFPKLVRHGLVKSFRGAVRGYTLTKAPEEITLREILEAVEGPDISQRCFFGETPCDVTNPCLLHCRWREIRSVIGDLLERTSLKELADAGHIQTAIGDLRNAVTQCEATRPAGRRRPQSSKNTAALGT